MSLLRMAVIGVGNMGQIHAHIYKNEIPDATLSAVCDVNSEQGKRIAQLHQTSYFQDYRELLGKVDAISIVVPTALHYEVALFFLKHHIPLLLEKPIASTIEQAEEIVKVAEQNQTILQIGHLERFNPVIKRFKQANIKPGYIEAYRIAQFTPRIKDVGVVLDLMIHDIDIVLHMTQSPIKSIHAVGVNIMGDYEDIANARIEFENGCVASLTASRVAMKRERKIRIFARDAYIILNYDKHSGQIIQKDPIVDGKWLLEHNITDLSSLNGQTLELVGNLVKVDNFSLSHEERPLQQELRSFVQCILDKKQPEVTGRDGLAALKLGVDICAQIEKFKRPHFENS